MITDPHNQPTTFTYEPTFNRVTSITDALSQVTQFSYDTSGNLTLKQEGGASVQSAGSPLAASAPEHAQAAGSLLSIALNTLGFRVIAASAAYARLITRQSTGRTWWPAAGAGR